MPTKYPRGCDLSRVPKAADIPAIDLKTILAVDTSNSFLRTLRVQQGLLQIETLPVDLRGIVPSLPTAKEEIK
jgi:hypothetical protein